MTVERSSCGSGGCITCPFSHNHEAYIAQNSGCLPDGYEILQLKVKHDIDWACHDDETKLCGGYANMIKNHYPELFEKIDHTSMMTYQMYDSMGMERAIGYVNAIKDIRSKKITI